MVNGWRFSYLDVFFNGAARESKNKKNKRVKRLPSRARPRMYDQNRFLYLGTTPLLAEVKNYFLLVLVQEIKAGYLGRLFGI